MQLDASVLLSFISTSLLSVLVFIGKGALTKLENLEKKNTETNILLNSTQHQIGALNQDLGKETQKIEALVVLAASLDRRVSVMESKMENKNEK